MRGFCPRLIALNRDTDLRDVTCRVGRGDSLSSKSVGDMLAGFMRTVHASLCGKRSIGVQSFKMFDLSTHAGKISARGRYATGGVVTIGVGFHPSSDMHPGLASAQTNSGVRFVSVGTTLRNGRSRGNKSKSVISSPATWVEVA